MEKGRNRVREIPDSTFCGLCQLITLPPHPLYGRLSSPIHIRENRQRLISVFILLYPTFHRYETKAGALNEHVQRCYKWINGTLTITLLTSLLPISSASRL